MASFYLCSVCGNLIEKVNDGNTDPSCCGRTMRKLRSESTDGSIEKHVPAYRISCLDSSCSHVKQILVQVGSSAHPMEMVHRIEWIEIETDKGIQRRKLAINDNPVAEFYVDKDEKLLNVYAYCNLHGLFVKEIADP